MSVPTPSTSSESWAPHLVERMVRSPPCCRTMRAIACTEYRSRSAVHEIDAITSSSRRETRPGTLRRQASTVVSFHRSGVPVSDSTPTPARAAPAGSTDGEASGSLRPPSITWGAVPVCIG
ncbi:hypothetical protein [Streptomyces bacillaris]|uniref:hypothetical protein n=1 Tax=Streptomyces bacillaris TaxID=68179 RepID=UPI001AD60746